MTPPDARLLRAPDMLLYPSVRLILLVAAPALLAARSDAQTLKAERIISGVENVTWIGSPPTDDRIFLTEQIRHDISVFTASGAPLGTFLDLTGTSTGAGYQGVYSMAFDPDYAANGYFYVYYSYGTSGARIERYQVSSDPNVAIPSSGYTIIELAQPFTEMWAGGQVGFGPDGFLYFAWGDGVSGGDPTCNSQRGDTLLGKMLRIDVHGDDFPASVTANYAIPPSNPFVGDASIRDEIFHFGLRNPWRWTFDEATGAMYISDVGQDGPEEISFAPAGASGLNFGWKVMEGDSCFSTSGCPVATPICGSPLLTAPIHEIATAGAFGPCAVIGGVVYRGCSTPELDGTYFFSDYCDNKVWTFKHDPVTGLTDLQDRTAELTPSTGTLSAICTFGHDANGEVLIGDRDEVFRVSAAVRSFSPDVCNVSVSGGGTQSWSLDPGSSYGGQLYFIGGSLTGTGGIASGSVVVPLTLDFYTMYSLNMPNEPPLLNTLGTLDGSGHASASFSAGLLPVALVGTRAYHAYAVFGVAMTASFASNAVALDFGV